MAGTREKTARKIGVFREERFADAQSRPRVAQSGDRLLAQPAVRAQQLRGRHGGELGVVRDDSIMAHWGVGRWKPCLKAQVARRPIDPPEHVRVAAQEPDAFVRGQAVAVGGLEDEVCEPST